MMAKPTPHPLGRANLHVQQSRGAENYIMNFYVTNYSTSFTKPSIDSNKTRAHDIPAYSGREVFAPRSAPENKRTGFVSNVRPQIYYNRTLDEFDNPIMGRLLDSNYTTITQSNYQAYKLNDGFEELPVKVAGQTSAYTQTYNHNPRPIEVAEKFIDTQIRAPFDVTPKHQALLHKKSNHDPISNENFGYGPSYMSTEYATRYDPNPQSRTAFDPLLASVGPKETSGFVSNKETEDALTGTPGERWLMKSRSTGVSDYKNSFLPYEYPRNPTQLPNILDLDKSKESSFTKSFRPSDINPKNNTNTKSEYKSNYLGKRALDPKRSEILDTAQIGPKESAGHSKCEKGFTQTLDDPRRFITNYQVRHFDMNPKNKDREGHVTGGINGYFDDGYTINPKVHNSGSLNTLSELKNMDSYQSRSVRSRDVYHDDHTHDNKFPIKNKAVTFQEVIST